MKKCLKCGAVQNDSNVICTYPYCNNNTFESVIKSSRELAIQWWYTMNSLERGLRCPEHRNQASLTGREIQEIWRKETKDSSDREIIEETLTEPQVDFEMLWYSINKINNHYKCMPSHDELDNLKLFFNLLMTKPTFGNVVYRKLNELNTKPTFNKQT